MNMTQEEIERFLAEQASQNSNEQYGFDDADLASLLSELGEEDDSDIQEISNLLNRADNNEAVADDVVALMQRQEAEGETAYEAMDLFSGEQAEKKEGFFKRLFSKFKKKKKEKPESTEQAEQTEQQQEWESIKEETASDSMAEALALLSGGTDAFGESGNGTSTEAVKEEKASKKKKEKKTKKPKKEKKHTTEGTAAEDNDEQLPDKASKKKKKVKEKKAKEKKPKDEPIREKKSSTTVEQLLEEDEQETPHKKKIIMVFVAAVMIMLGFLIVNHYFTGHANKQLAEEAYEAEDYLECYQLLYGQNLNDSQTAMFHRSELILQKNIFWNHYQEFVADNKLLESLDELVQFVFEYPSLSNYAAKWNCQDIVEGTYKKVLGILSEDYKVNEQEVLDIAALEDDVDYTKALVNLVEEKQKNDAIEEAYPDILPQEQDRITQN